MQERSLYEYAVVRLVPSVYREEFLNVGVVLYCREKKFLRVKYHLEAMRLSAIWPELDIAQVEEHLFSFHQICEGKGISPIAQLPIAERFRWLTATRSTIIQSSKVHPGFCHDPESTLEELFAEMVL
ncbi:DUF3037 domain-containing protein [Olivibacter sitiensis]|uniref:DUF3037 domain-containing protein n=1 Tax=Olivibacter sitiensis TaxID=376470 RepID=UPI00040833E0|nr:DUF3037 domain-containing protein [Olivibacter sitiensis]